MAFEELNTNNVEWEVFHNSDGMYVPIMDEYPSPENTFDVWSGVDDEPQAKSGIDPELLAGAFNTAVTIGADLYANRDSSKQELKQVCGRKPFCIGKGRCKDKKDKHNACKQSYYTPQQSGGNKSTPPPAYIPPRPPRPQGMSTSAKVGIALSIVALGVGGYFLYRRSKAKG